MPGTMRWRRCARNLLLEGKREYFAIWSCCCLGIRNVFLLGFASSNVMWHRSMIGPRCGPKQRPSWVGRLKFCATMLEFHHRWDKHEYWWHPTLKCYWSISGWGGWQHQHNGCWQHPGSNVCPQEDAAFQWRQWWQDYHHCIRSWTYGKKFEKCTVPYSSAILISK